jgi:hypothetical protein
MKEKRLLNELGNVNDEFVEQAKPKIKYNRKRLYAVIGSVAAAAAVFAVVFALSNHIPGNDTIPTDSSNAVEEISSATIAEIPLTFKEVKMPPLSTHSSGGGDELGNFHGISEAKFSLIPLELDRLIEESCPEGTLEDYYKWSEEYEKQHYNLDKIPPINIEEAPFFPNIVRKYSLDHDTIVEMLKKRNDVYKQQAADNNLGDEYSEYIYTDEEIEAIASGDVQKCYDLVTFTKSIRKGNFIYTPAYIYTATMEEIEAAGITAQELADRAFYFTTFSLSGEQLTAFQNKLLTYIAKSAQKDKFSGTYIIPYEATLSVPKRIRNAEFIKENVTDINETNNPERSELEASYVLICYRSDSSDDGLAYDVFSKLPSNPYAIFDYWKKKNNIGDDVKLIKCSITDNSKEEITESTATYTPATKRIVEITVSKDIENYYDKSKTLLLHTLEETFKSSFNFCDEYQLIIK